MLPRPDYHYSVTAEECLFYDAYMLHMAVESAFEDLLANWRAHENRRTNPTTSYRELAASRARLDVARSRMSKLRLAIHPDNSELESVIETIWCESLDVVVHLRRADIDEVRPGNLRCPCGSLIPINWDNLPV